jgi:indole-3-glycerol phosphate synthase
MNILDTIIATKHNEVHQLKSNGVSVLENSIYFNKKTNSLKESINTKKQLHIIAEFKRQSPSKGIINNEVAVKLCPKRRKCHFDTYR